MIRLVGEEAGDKSTFSVRFSSVAMRKCQVRRLVIYTLFVCDLRATPLTCFCRTVTRNSYKAPSGRLFHFASGAQLIFAPYF